MTRTSRGRIPVVVIADGARERSSAEALLAREGFDVEGAVDAAAVLDCLRDRRPDVVVVGLGRRWQALDLVRRLRGRFEGFPLPAAPRIVVAAHELDEAPERFARSLGVDAVLHRPVGDHQLVRTVRTLMFRSASAPQNASA